MHPFIVDSLRHLNKLTMLTRLQFHIVVFEVDHRDKLPMADEDIAVRVDEHHTLDRLRECDLSDYLLVIRPDFDQAITVSCDEFSRVRINEDACKRVFMVLLLAQVDPDQPQFALR